MNMQPDHTVSGEELKCELVRQRDQALVGAILAAALAIVILWRNLGIEHSELGDLQQTITQHRELLAGNEKVLMEVHAALLADQQALEKLRQAKRNSP